MNTNSLFKLFEMAFFIGVFFLLSSCMSMMALPNHSSGMNHSNPNMINSESNLDVVCGKTVEANQQSFSTQYKNKTYYFDSEVCLNKFQQSPDDYINNPAIAKKSNNLVYWGLGAAAMGVMMFFMIY